MHVARGWTLTRRKSGQREGYGRWINIKAHAALTLDLVSPRLSSPMRVQSRATITFKALSRPEDRLLPDRTRPLTWVDSPWAMEVLFRPRPLFGPLIRGLRGGQVIQGGLDPMEF